MIVTAKSNGSLLSTTVNNKILPVDEYFDVVKKLIQSRIRSYFNGKQPIALPSLEHVRGPLAPFVSENKLNHEDHLVLILALLPHIRPDFYDTVVKEALPESGDFPLIGGVRGRQFRSFMPTAETILFLLAGENWMARLEIFQRVFGPEHFLAAKKILWIETPSDAEPLISGKLTLNQSFIVKVTTGTEYVPHYSTQFPAKQLRSKMEWDDVVLNAVTMKQLDELRFWLHHNGTLMNDLGMGKKIAPGYRALFYGPPGTGKTLSATLLGKEFSKHVFRVDLSMVVSKYIGETEKNLARLFDEADFKNWILFFDEADALFGKRAQVKEAHDRYANQEVSFLMQRIESFEGLVILASNLKGNMDDAFARRFQSIIFFPYPTPEEQLILWNNAFPENLKPAEGVDLSVITKRYKLTGANVMNIVQYCCLTALAHQNQTISRELLIHAIERELTKEGKVA
jgi:hypothetical protein